MDDTLDFLQEMGAIEETEPESQPRVTFLCGYYCYQSHAKNGKCLRPATAKVESGLELPKEHRYVFYICPKCIPLLNSQSYGHGDIEHNRITRLSI